jgi:hypothetical protein
MKWTFEARDATNGTWIAVGDNAFAQDWTWSRTTVALPLPASRFFSGSSLQLRYQTQSNVDASDVDQLVVLASVNSSGSGGSGESGGSSASGGAGGSRGGAGGSSTTGGGAGSSGGSADQRCGAGARHREHGTEKGQSAILSLDRLLHVRAVFNALEQRRVSPTPTS